MNEVTFDEIAAEIPRIKLINMEKITTQDKYVQNLYEFSQKVVLSPEFIDALSKHHYFSDGMKSVLVSFQINTFLYSIII